MAEDTKEEVNKITEKLDEKIQEGPQHYPWFPLDSIAGVTGSTAQHIETVITQSSDFVENSQNEFTTRQLYEKYVPFWLQLMHAFRGKIE